MGIRFSILGTLSAELRTAGSGAAVELDPGPFKQRLLLALLLCRCGDTVRIDQLIDAVWWDNPPRTARKNIQVYVAHLRKFLAAHGQPDRIRSVTPGYQLRLTAAEVDALRFEELSREGRLALRQGDAHAAAGAMRQALGLWRGRALADLRVSPILREEAARLDGRRLAAYEDWFDAELMLGNHAQVLDEIESVVREHPLRERLRGQHLTALYRGGRQAEALAEYDNLRQLLAAELGLAPSPALQRLYQDLLSGDLGMAELPAVAVPGQAPVPDTAPAGEMSVPAPLDVVAHIAAAPAGQVTARAARPGGGQADGLPRATDDFVGRREQLQGLLTFLGTPPGTRRLAAVTGPPGSGTTTLALQAAHLLASRYRDGVALLPLCAADGVPRSPADLAADLLGRLAAPAGTGHQAGPGEGGGAGDPASAFRRRLSGLQMLLILDDAADEAQVRPLLPGSGDSSVIVTSCRHLGGLDGVTRFQLGFFTEDEALELLSRIIGTTRVGQAPDAALRVVRACGLLPLAVRIAGARLAILEHLPLERFAGRLEDRGQLLDELTVGDLSIRERFDRYQRGLDTAERLALLQVATAWGAVTGGAGEMQRLLERLAGVHALRITEPDVPRPAPAPPFAMPAPLWVYAQQLLSSLSVG
jgi:DNA-binding SARP family transcriptional activator